MGIELTQPAKDLLAKRGYDPVLGARPLRRTIQREIEDVLVREDPLRRGAARPDRAGRRQGEGDEATFTFVGEDKAALPDAPPVEEIAGTQE